ncbi:MULTISPECIES: tetratricopeptide repeat protein [unclassified Novosphingobium]|uniref:tetratricopeptide repeat protein n=1 Tax=Novosphingobium TaxID=165696 RepID=UPI0014462EBB|nr:MULTISPECIES: hypothetical protein [unclassified Novosphingobium]NKJ42668.1 tetratricopeptide (TPR) repeat protein [Novosphingobium sp. SG720]NMN05692.1 tetratricopeptide (TPR) repeat protein [Novosphingobium sp. SG919]NMN87948.1 tetratricopeptide (TPR) repeat protein [Novosphingobium sp. SG916]
MLLAAALLASSLSPVWHQIGPNPRPMEFGALPTPGRRKAAQADDGPPPEKHDRLADCLTVGRSNPDLAISLARHWLDEVKLASERVRANQCLGMMLSQQGDFEGAQAAFGEAVGLIPEAQAVGAVPLMAMAGNAALAAGKPQDALTWLNRALVVRGFADNLALSAIQNDRARALVALNRNADAATALARSHELAPQNAEGWLLSATLHRRDKDLVAAQHDIEEAARLAPRDPAVGVEAGVIAMLGNREDAARQSWQSVVAMAPASDEARVARGYLEQIGAAPTSIPAPPDPGQDKEITR